MAASRVTLVTLTQRQGCVGESGSASVHSLPHYRRNARPVRMQGGVQVVSTHRN